MAATLREAFPHLAASDTALSPIRGGRAAAEAILSNINPERYERTRNYLDGAVTRLSAYLRHGVVTLAEVRDAVLQRVADPRHAAKLVNELAWRDFWQRIYMRIGEGIWQDREDYKTGFTSASYGADLPGDIQEGTTTLACMDSFSADLRATGYLHNHARMWLAAYLVHWRRVRWQAGARWFLQHLVDGDPASNNLSWQWVASTFASKPYFFNRENLERYTGGAYCRTCPHAQNRRCPFESDYEGLEQRLFPRLHSAAASTQMPTPPAPFARPHSETRQASPSGKPLLWIHIDSLNPRSPMLSSHPDAPAVFLWDTPWLVESGTTLKRLVFVAECLAELPGTIELRFGDATAELLHAARAAGADYILAQRTPDPRLQKAAANATANHVPVVWYDPPAFVEETRAFDLKRFSRYWQRAQHSAMMPTRS